MSKEHSNIPEIYSHNKKLDFIRLFESDTAGRRRHDIFYLLSDDYNHSFVNWVRQNNNGYLEASDIGRFKSDISDIACRRIWETNYEKDVKIQYHTSKWNLPIDIHITQSNFLHLHINLSSSEALALLTYTPDGYLGSIVLDQDYARDFHDDFVKEQEYERQMVKQFKKDNPTATKKEINRVRNMAFNRWRKLEHGRNSVASIKDNQIAFYENSYKFTKGKVGQIEQLESGHEYSYFGDTYQITIQDDLIKTETTRENGRKKILNFLTYIGDIGQLQNPDSFYWTNIPALEDLYFEIKQP